MQHLCYNSIHGDARLKTAGGTKKKGRKCGLICGTCLPNAAVVHRLLRKN